MEPIRQKHVGPTDASKRTNLCWSRIAWGKAFAAKAKRARSAARGSEAGERAAEEASAYAPSVGHFLYKRMSYPLGLKRIHFKTDLLYKHGPWMFPRSVACLQGQKRSLSSQTRRYLQQISILWPGLETIVKMHPKRFVFDNCW